MPIPKPVAFTVFGLDIMWYGIIIAMAMIVAVIIMYFRAEKHNIPKDRVLDFVLICIPIGVVGSRFYYVIFNWEYYQGDFWSIINLRNGGLAIHGGLIFGLAAAAILCVIWNYHPFNVLDLAVPSVAIAQSIGRWGNYFNSEAHGGPTDLPWAIIVDGQKVHPTFLYESIWCFLLFFILIIVDNRRKFEGQAFLLYGILYSIERFFVEALRTDSLMLGPFLKQAQVISLVIIVLFTLIYIIKLKNAKQKGRIFY